MHDIFISYKVMNRENAIEYYRNLKQMNLDVWFDQLIPKGQKWNNYIRKNIINSKFFLCLISKHTVNDKWVLNQLDLARRYKKRIIFINLDQSPIAEFKKYKITEPVYHSLKEIDFSKMSEPVQKYRDYLYYSDVCYKKNNKPFFLIAIISLISLLTYFLGINFFNLKLSVEISYLFMGIFGMYIASLFGNKKVYIINSGISLLLLLCGMYALEPYYITDISIIPLVYLFLYFFTFLVRYSNNKSVVLSYVFSFLYALLIVLFTGSINVFFIYVFDIDVSWFNILMLVGFDIYVYFNSLNHFRLRKDLKDTNDLINGKDIVRKVEGMYEN